MLDNRELKRLLLATALRGEGAAEAFEALYRQSAPLLLGIALRLVRRRELAEEIVHDSFTRIWGAAASFDPVAGQALAWMVAIARNRALDVLQSHDVSRVDLLDAEVAEQGVDALFDWAPDPALGLEQQHSSRLLRECLAGLQAGERQSLLLAYAHGMSHRDLAAHLRKPLGTVKSWVRRGLENLRACVERRAERPS